MRSLHDRPLLSLFCLPLLLFLAAPTGLAMAAPPKADSAASVRDSLAAVADSAASNGSVGDSASLERATVLLTTRSENAPPESLVTPAPVSVPVFLGGKEVFRVRASRDGLNPAQRAAAIRARLTVAVADTHVPSDSVRMVSTPQGVEVRLGRDFLWVITPGDVEGVDPAALTADMAALPQTLRDGIDKERASRRPLGILISALIALGVLLVAYILFRLLRAGGERWRQWLVDFLPKHVGGVRLRNFEVFSQNQVVGLVGGVLGRMDSVVGLVLLYFFLTLEFSLFPWTQGWSWQLLHFASTQLFEMGRSVVSALPGLFVIAVIVFITRWLTNLTGRFFDAIEAGTQQFPGIHRELARPSKRLLRMVLWVAAVIIAFPYIPGAQSKAFQGVSLFLGVLVSLGSTGIVGNVISGLVLTYSRSFKVGDRVKIGEQVGDVLNLGFFATKLRTIRNEEVTIPNGQVAASAIVNYTRLAEDPGLILHTQVTIGYDVEWRKVHEMMIEAALSVEGVEKEPRPWVWQRSLDDSYVNYEINCITHESHPQLRLYSDLHAAIQDVFNRAGVEILSPAYHAIRDANEVVLPPEPKGPRAEPGGFRIRNT